MIKSKFGPNMLAKDKQDLDNLIEGAVAEVGCDYGAVLEFVTDTVHDEKYSSALKYNVIHKTSWFLKYLHTTIELRAS